MHGRGEASSPVIIRKCGFFQNIFQGLDRFARKVANPLAQTVGKGRMARRQSRSVEHHARVGKPRDAEEFVGLVPDHIEIAGDALQEIEARRAALAVLEGRKIGRRHADRRRHLLLRDALAAAQLARAEQAALASREQLTRLLGLSGERVNYALPDRLPPLPKAVPELGDVQALALRDRLDVRSAQAQNTAVAGALGLTHATSVVNAMELGVARNSKFDNGPDRSRRTQRGFELDVPIPVFDWGQARNGRAEALYLQSAARVRNVGVLAASEAREAWQGWNTAYAIARRYRDEVLPLRKQVNEEMVLRYNGMLASVWELLGETRASMLAVNAGIEAQRDFWLADTDLQLVLTGSSPGGMTALQAAVAAGDAPAAGAH